MRSLKSSLATCAFHVLLLATLATTLTSADGHAAEFGNGPLPIAFEPSAPVTLMTDQTIRIDGAITGSGPATVVLRIDDGQSTGYASRMNDERTLPPGPFSLRYDIGALKTTNGRPLVASDIRRVIFFVHGAGNGIVTRFDTAVKTDQSAPPAISNITAKSQPVASVNPGITSFAIGTLPIAFEPTQAVALPPGQQLTITGKNTGTTPAQIVLRIDDGTSTNYPSRMNDERMLPPGPFTLQYDTSDLRATNGRPIDIADIRRVILFVNGQGTAEVTRFDITSRATATTDAPQIAPKTAVAAESQNSSGPKFDTGALPIALEPSAAISLPAGKVVRIDGSIAGTAAANLVLRVDDGASTNYASRMNDERTLQPGPFSLRIPTSSLRATSGRALDLNSIRRVILFIDGPGSGAVTRFDIADISDASPSAPQLGTTIHSQAPATRSSASAPALAPRQFPIGRLPQSYEAATPITFADDDQIAIEGTIESEGSAAVAIRIDDGQSSTYATRYNDERLLPSGPFKLSIGIKGLKTPGGRILDHRDIRRMFVFIWKGNATVTLTKFEARKGLALPLGAKGYSFGANDAALPPGFERIGPEHKFIEARGKIEVVRRPAPDPIVANGLRGIRKVRLPAAPGPTRVTVWSEDPGEWEELPREFERRIQINGKDALVVKNTADEWIEKRYLRGRTTEHSTSDDAWTAYGQKRGNRRHTDINVGPTGIEVELSGADPAAYFLSAILIEPITDQITKGPSPGQQVADAQRAEWYRSKYPVVESPQATTDAGVPVILGFANKNGQPPQTIKLTAAPDSGARIRIDVTSDDEIERPRIELITPKHPSGAAIGGRIWAGAWRLERDDTVLRRTDNFLRADVAELPLRRSDIRTYEIWLDIPKGAPTGRYAGSITINGNNKQRRNIAIELAVLPVNLPQPKKPAGFYLARAPHLTYFAGLAIERDRQVECDLKTMRGFGLANTAPPIAGLDRTDLSLFSIDMRRAMSNGVADHWLIYNPLHALLEKNGPQRTAAIVARLEAVVRTSGLPPPVWSVADEPSNPDQPPGELAAWTRALRQQIPTARLAGHLNTPADQKFVPLFDTLLINPSFGIDTPDVARLSQIGKDVWYYNTFKPRFTAGTWLWATAATKYVQWHARMPTADPFDPIDGREADFQVLYPMREICAKTPDIHRDLLRMAEGIVDQRWLQWLETQKSPLAPKLVIELKRKYSGRYMELATATRTELEAVLDRIKAVAQSPN